VHCAPAGMPCGHLKYFKDVCRQFGLSTVESDERMIICSKMKTYGVNIKADLVDTGCEEDILKLTSLVNRLKHCGHSGERSYFIKTVDFFPTRVTSNF
jgi:hypothetical protein